MPTKFSRRAVIAAPVLATLPFARAAWSADGEWKPDHTLRIVVPQPPGGTTDVMARLLSTHLQQAWGQSVVVENKPGAGGAIGTLDVVRAAPDGHTILMGNVGPQSISYALERNLPYTPNDLIPVSNMIYGPNALVVHPSFPAKTVPEFVDYIKSHPEKANYGTPGLGQSPHLSAVLFDQMTGTKTTAVHYRGSGPAMTDLLAGSIQFVFNALVNVVGPVNGGLLRMLAVTGSERYPTLPDIPTIRETMPQLKDFVVTSWVGAFVAKGTSVAAVAAINHQIKVMLEAPGQRDRFIAMGGLPGYTTSADYAKFVLDETQRWSRVIRDAGIHTSHD